MGESTRQVWTLLGWGLCPCLGPCECRFLLVSVATLSVHPSMFKQKAWDLASWVLQRG